MGEEHVTFTAAARMPDILKISVWVATDVGFLGNGGGADGFDYDVAVWTDLDGESGFETDVCKEVVVAAGWPVGGKVGEFGFEFTG